jgi:hypothetical protein
VYSLAKAMAMLVLTGDTCGDVQALKEEEMLSLLYLSKTSILSIDEFQ